MEKEINKILGDLLIQLAQKNMGALDEIHHFLMYPLTVGLSY